MSALLFKLYGVPEDEADEVRAMLEANDIDFYETTEGKWGVSMPAIWLKNDAQLDEAKRLLSDYQAARCDNARQAHRQDQHEGKNKTLRQKVAEEPLRVLAYLAVIVLIITLSLKPFLEMIP